MALPSRTAVQLAGARVNVVVLRLAVQVRTRAGKSAAQRQQRIHDSENERPFADDLGKLPEDAEVLFHPTPSPAPPGSRASSPPVPGSGTPPRP